MFRKNRFEIMLDGALALCKAYKKNFEELLKAHNDEKAAADMVIDTQKKIIGLQQAKIELLEEKIILLEGKK